VLKEKMNLTPGTLLQRGKYRIEKVLGIGRVGITYQATDTYLAQTVTLKTLNDSLYQYPSFAKFQQQFIAQAHRFSWCQHPNIARVLDFFEEGGLCFVVMEYVFGQSLAQLIKSGQRLTETEALHYIRQIASALKTLHQGGLVHRDIKPENIIQRTGTNLVMLTDFGISFEFAGLTVQNYNSLKPAGYAPMEQYIPETEEKNQAVLAIAGSSRPSLGVAQKSHRLTPATDIYGLAATFYYLLAGEAPVPAPLRDRIPLFSLRQVQPQLCAGIERAILWGLEMNAHQRPQTVEHWLTFLEEQQLLERQREAREEAESYQLSLFPSSILILFLFFFTSGTSGWLGFDFTRRSISVAMIKKIPTTDRSLTPRENLRSPEFRNLDTSKPLFVNPSVESNPNLPLEESKTPQANFNSFKANSNSGYTPIVTAEPTPTTNNLTPAPEYHNSGYYAPEAQSQQAQSYTPKVESQETQSYSPESKATLLPDEAIAPSQVTIPEVAPLPPEPIKSYSSTSAPASANAEVSPFPVTEPAAPLPEVKPLLPNSDHNSVESAAPSPSDSGLEPNIPFPEPSSN
jgi:serine/threonine protein kinase